MKRVKCQLCNGAWIVDEQDLECQKVCPYCGSSIQGKVDFENYDSLDKAIYGVISNMGIGIIQNLRLLSGFMMDIAPSLKKEIRIFTKTITEDYIGLIKDAFNQETDAVDATIKKLRHLFIDKEGLSDVWADMICEGLHGAILYYKGVGCTKLVNVQVEDFQVQHMKGHTEREKPQRSKSVAHTQPSVQKNTSHIAKFESKPKTGASLQSSMSNDPRELCKLALKYYNGTSPYPKDEKKAIKLFRESANYHQYIPAYNYLGRIFMKRRESEISSKWYQKSADAGNVEGYCMMGYFYQTGHGVKRQSSTEALECYLKAASTGELDQMVSIAIEFLVGGDIPKTERVGVDILDIAAKSGNPDAQYYLAQCYQNGIGVQKDTMESIELYKSAAENGQAEAKAELQKFLGKLPFSEILKYKLKG